MARLTFDAIAIQSVIGSGESVTVLEAAQRAFCPEEITVSAVAILRAKRACKVLQERGLVEMDPASRMRLKSVTEREGEAGMQLFAIITRTIITQGPSVADELETG